MRTIVARHQLPTPKTKEAGEREDSEFCTDTVIGVLRAEGQNKPVGWHSLHFLANGNEVPRVLLPADYLTARHGEAEGAGDRGPHIRHRLAHILRTGRPAMAAGYREAPRGGVGLGKA